MMNTFLRKNLVKLLLLVFSILLPGYLLAAEDNNYSSQLINQSKHAVAGGYTLIKTRVWPETGCVIDSGKGIIPPGESTQLKIAKKKECDQAGIGYSLYKSSDVKNTHLLGYVSHRFRDGKFSLQVSIFCEGDQCIFRGLNPQQVTVQQDHQ